MESLRYCLAINWDCWQVCLCTILGHAIYLWIFGGRDKFTSLNITSAMFACYYLLKESWLTANGSLKGITDAFFLFSLFAWTLNNSTGSTSHRLQPYNHYTEVKLMLADTLYCVTSPLVGPEPPRGGGYTLPRPGNARMGRTLFSPPPLLQFFSSIHKTCSLGSVLPVC